MKAENKQLEFREFASDKDRENLKVFKSNNLIEAKYKLSLNEQKLILLLASTIKPDDEDFKPVKFRIVDLHKYLGFEDDTNHTYLRQLTEKLIGRVLRIWDLEKKTLLQISWLSSAKYYFKEGIIELCFDPQLKPFLLKLREKFTAYSLQIAVRFDSAYSIRIYELLKQYEKIGKRVISIKELRELLGIKREEYKRYFDFKRRVIIKAYNELKEKADIYFEFEEKKKGRKIEEIVFYIHKNPNFEEKIDIKDKKPEIKVVEKKEPILKVQNEELLNKIKEYTNLADDKLKKIFNSYEETYIGKIFNLTLKKYQEGKIDNITAFFLAGLKENYLKLSPYEEKKRKEQEEKEKQERLKDEIQEKILKFNREYWEVVRQYVLDRLENLKEEQKRNIKKEFIKQISKNKLLKEEFLRKDYKSPIIKMALAKFILEFMEDIEPPFANFLEFLRQKGFNFDELNELKEGYLTDIIKNLKYLLKIEKKLKELKVPTKILATISITDKGLREEMERKITDYLFNSL